MDNVVAVAALTLTGTIAAGFFAIINKQDKTYQHLVQTLDGVAKAKDREAKATVEGFAKLTASSDRTANEAKERNGHLAEQTTIVAEIAKKGVEASERILERLEKSETALEKNTKLRAEAVEHVKTDLEDNNPLSVKVAK